MQTIHQQRMRHRRLDQHTRQRTYPYVDKSKYNSDGTYTDYYQKKPEWEKRHELALELAARQRLTTEQQHQHPLQEDGQKNEGV